MPQLLHGYKNYAKHLVPMPLLDGEWWPLLLVVVVILISVYRIIDFLLGATGCYGYLRLLLAGLRLRHQSTAHQVPATILPSADRIAQFLFTLNSVSCAGSCF